MGQTIRDQFVSGPTGDRALERIFGVNTAERTVYRYILESEEPKSAAQIATAVDCALTSAYRYVNTLEDRGLIEAVTDRTSAQQPTVYAAEDPDHLADKMQDCVDEAFQTWLDTIEDVAAESTSGAGPLSLR